MKKNSIKLTGALAASLCACCVCLLSCSKDDADSNGSSVSYPKEDLSIINTSDGGTVLLSSIDNDIRINYDELCRPTYYRHWDGGDFKYNISYDPYKITPTSDSNFFDMDEVSLSADFYESNGYLSKFVLDGAYDDDDETVKWSIQNFKYDSSGHLTGLAINVSGTADGYSMSYTYNYSATWSNGNLTKSSWSLKESWATVTWTSSFEYGDDTNQYRQPTLALIVGAADPDGYVLTSLYLLGYLGTGTANLPTSASYSETYKAYGEEDEDSWSDSFSYTKNEDGTIATEYFDGWNWAYSYYAVESATDTDAEESESLSSAARPSRSHGTIGSHDWRTRIHAAARHAAENAAVTE